jgi:hypothetical protein
MSEECKKDVEDAGLTVDITRAEKGKA